MTLIVSAITLAIFMSGFIVGSLNAEVTPPTACVKGKA